MITKTITITAPDEVGDIVELVENALDRMAGSVYPIATAPLDDEHPANYGIVIYPKEN